jgi:uncharacterized YigZ family protein
MSNQPEKEQHFYCTIDKPSVAEFKDRGSKFIAHAYPINTTDDFKKYLLALKKEHPKAAHHCFAYRIGTDARPTDSSGRGNNFRVSDDGEPSGSAGRPILGQIDSKEMTNVAIIVVRYFGGTLLGVPGLINAYKTATSLALQVVLIVQKQIEINYQLQFDYTQMNEVMMVLKQFSCSVISQELQLFCVMKAGIPLNRLDEVLFKLKEIRGLHLDKMI